VQGSRKYAQIDASLVATLARCEGAKAGSEKDAIKRVKRKLHQMVGAYLETAMPYQDWLETLRGAADPAARRQACADILLHHASSRERLAELESIYLAIFADTTPETVLDLACGLNPLGRPFMPLAETTRYLAADVHQGLVEFLAAALPLLAVPGHAFMHDLLTGPPPVAADVVLLLKALPCLEQADRAIGRTVLNSLQAPVIIVSYPTASLGGGKRGMQRFYQERFAELLPPDRFAVETHLFASELVFKLRRQTSE
jgi:16S rRNA (guanine(1405)-N(7))-methyltransferase